MKKHIKTIVLVLVAFIIGYFVGDSSAINRVKKQIGQNVVNQQNNINEEEVKDESSTKQEPNKEDEVPIYPDEIAPTIKILEPNSIGVVYMEATYTNNSKYPITSYTAKVLLKDKNETTYLSTHDTVMPGEISPSFETFGPSTQKEEDYEILTLDVRARLDNGKTLAIEYDFKLEEATWSEYNN